LVLDTKLIHQKLLSPFIKSVDLFEQLFNIGISEKIKISTCHFDVESFDSQLFQYYDISIPASIALAVTKRQAEFLAGRLMARQALALIGHEGFTVAIGDDRTPIWPNGIIGSISHSNQIALCITANQHEFSYIGCDVEPFITIQTQKEICDTIINHAEKRLIQNSPLGQKIAFTLAFSAKESLFKALYTTVKRYFDFSAAHIYDINPGNQTFKLKLVESLTDTLVKDTIFDGTYILNQTYITTFIIL
jgi:4'-phosphopantetheinyl transferase EntD